jgi:hypothetical protein
MRDSLSTGYDLTRRDALLRVGGGAGAIALAAMGGARASNYVQDRAIDLMRPLSPRQGHFAGKAKRILWLFQYGGAPAVDLFDHKPELYALNGKPLPESIKGKASKVGGVLNSSVDRLLAEPFAFSRHGRSGQWVSDLMPHTARHVDDLCFIKSMHSESSNHAPATYQMNTGVILGDRPSLGSWVTYGLGSEGENLPGFVVLFEVGGFGGTANWSNAFLPAAFQATKFRNEGDAVFNLKPRRELEGTQRRTLDLIQELNRGHAAGRAVPDLQGRMASYELAYRMQSAAMEVGDFGDESAATLELYGVNDGMRIKAQYGRQCLMARRLLERGVRVVQVYQGVDKYGWDGHDDNQAYARRNAMQTDQATGALLVDLKRRGMLEDTLVIWAGEFGRTPMLQGSKGRNHNPYGFTVWLAGGGVRGGQSIGTTDAVGLRAEEDPVSVKDFHATILHAVGLRNDDLFFEHNGRPERLTGVAGTGKVVKGVFA